MNRDVKKNRDVIPDVVERKEDTLEFALSLLNAHFTHESERLESIKGEFIQRFLLDGCQAINWNSEKVLKQNFAVDLCNKLKNVLAVTAYYDFPDGRKIQLPDMNLVHEKNAVFDVSIKALDPFECHQLAKAMIVKINMLRENWTQRLIALARDPKRTTSVIQNFSSEVEVSVLAEALGNAFGGGLLMFAYDTLSKVREPHAN